MKVLSLFDWIVLILSLLMSLWILFGRRMVQQASESEVSYTCTEGQPYEYVPQIKVGMCAEVRYIQTSRRDKKQKKLNKLGLSAVSKAILKDYGAILSRRQRKHYSKVYGVPFIAYRGR